MPSNSNKALPLLLLAGAALLSLGAGSARKSFFPVRGGKISSGFGNRINPITKKKEFHNGIDIDVPEGTPVDSVMSGHVSRIYTTDVGGLQMIIQHDDGSIAGYAHLKSALVKEGAKIYKGELIALSGKTGQTTGAHLHFSFRNRSGKYQDPDKIFSFS